MRRTLLAALVGALLAPALVLAGPASDSAHALLPPPPAPLLPTSVLAQITGSTLAPTMAAGTVTTSAATGTVVAGGGSTLAAAGGATVAGAGVAALAFGFTIGTGIAELVGIDATGLYASEFDRLFPGEGFVPNGDVLPTAPGFANGDDKVNVYKTGTTASGVVQVSLPDPFPAFGSEGNAATTAGGAWTASLISTQGPASGATNIGVRAQAMCKTVSTGVVAACSSTAGIVAWNIQQNGTIQPGWSGSPYYSVNPVTKPLSRPYWNGNAATKVLFDHWRFLNDHDSVVGSIWYPEGHASRPPTVSADPDRLWDTRLQCRDGSSTSSQSAPFKESDDSFPFVPAANPCPGAGLPSRLEVWEVVPTDSSLDHKVTEITYPDVSTDLVPAHCWQERCALELWRVDQSPSLRCTADPAACVDWYADVDKATRYECRYGGLVLELAECNVLRPTFAHQLGRAVKDDSGTDVQAPAPHGDPTTGTGNPVPSGSIPNNPPGTGENAGCPPPFYMVSVITGYWVYKGVLCALQEAFVPSAGFIEDEWGKQDVDFCQNAVGVIPCTVGDFVGPFGQLGNGTGGDCLGTRIAVPLPGNFPEFVFHPFQACGQIKVFSDFWLMVSSALTYLAAVYVAGRMLAKTINAQDSVV